MRAREEILLSSGFADKAYIRYAIEANQEATFLVTFRSIAKKYQTKALAKILDDLVASTPGQEGKWFAAAKDAGLYDEAITLAVLAAVAFRPEEQYSAIAGAEFLFNRADDNIYSMLDRRLRRPPQATHWSTRTMAAAAGISEASVRRIWHHQCTAITCTEIFQSIAQTTLIPDPPLTK